MNAHTWWDATVMASIRAGWFDADMVEGKLTSKRFEAVGHLYKNLTMLDEQIDFESLPPIVIFAPEVQHAGYIKRGTLPTGAVLMYLAPTLEFNSQRDVDHTVAHEFAHVVLRHYAKLKDALIDGLPHEQQPHEVEADALAAEWGFPKRKRGMNGFAKMLHRAPDQKVSA